MRDRNTGESLSRPFPRLQRTRRCRGRTSHTDFKRRTSKCPPFPYRIASGLPSSLLPAATPVSNAPTCRRRPPPYLHRHRDTLTTPTPSFAPSLHVATVSVFLQRRLPAAAAAANRRTQAQPSRRLATRTPSELRAAAPSLRTSNGKRLTTARSTGLLPPTVSGPSPAVFFTSYTSSSSPEHTSQ
jgi:hypothetical protein